MRVRLSILGLVGAIALTPSWGGAAATHHWAVAELWAGATFFGPEGLSAYIYPAVGASHSADTSPLAPTFSAGARACVQVQGPAGTDQGCGPISFVADPLLTTGRAVGTIPGNMGALVVDVTWTGKGPYRPSLLNFDEEVTTCCVGTDALIVAGVFLGNSVQREADAAGSIVSSAVGGIADATTPSGFLGWTASGFAGLAHAA